jgi:hypothetical protein
VRERVGGEEIDEESGFARGLRRRVSSRNLEWL